MIAKTVAVGSMNQVKIEGIRQAFEVMFPDIHWEVRGVEVDSEVSSQPDTDEETLRGAFNRARAAIAALNADFGVGPEGGLVKRVGTIYNNGWVAIVDRHGVESKAPSTGIEVAPALLRLLKQGIELGKAVDQVSGKTNSKQAGGHFAAMTDGAITRQEEFFTTTKAAFGKFLHPELFD